MADVPSFKLLCGQLQLYAQPCQNVVNVLRFGDEYKAQQ
jgi:hypothetical protein